MARPCTICTDARATEINRSLVDAPKQFREIAANYGVSHRALERHAENHMTDGLRRAMSHHAELIGETKNLDVMAALGRLTDRAEMMLAAADAWLRDPADPSTYNLNPRTHEVEVVYEEAGARKTAKLSHLMERLEQGLGVTIIKGESKTADTRKLLLDAVATLKPVLELLGKATGQIQEKQPVTLQKTEVIIRMVPPGGPVVDGERLD